MGGVVYFGALHVRLLAYYILSLYTVACTMQFWLTSDAISPRQVGAGVHQAKKCQCS